jgi:AraC-like DNA-binding protein
VAKSALHLADACYSKRTVRERFAVVSAWIEARLLVAHAPHDGVAWAAKQLQRSRGTHSIANLQHESGLNRAPFISVFRDQVGVAPKQYARILRFENALRFMRSGKSLSVSALGAGYYDQAHMHRDFSQFAGMTPASFMNATSFPNSVSMPEGESARS